MPKNLKLTLWIFIFSFLFSFLLTSSFNFFWEDFDSYRLDKEKFSSQITSENKLISTAKSTQEFITHFFQPERLFKISYESNASARPYEFITRDILVTFFGDNIIYYRAFKSLVFALNTCLIFLIISYASLFLAVLGSLLYITSAEMWVSTVYSVDAGLYMQFSILLSSLLFIKILRLKQYSRLKLWGYYLAILVSSNYAVLSKGDGRYLAVAFLLTLLFYRRNELMLHLPMLTIIFFMEIPVLGILRKIFIDQSYLPINIAAHNPLPIVESLNLIVKNYIYPRNAIGSFLLAAFFICLLANFLSLFKRRIDEAPKIENNAAIEENTFYFMLWAFFSLIMMALARSFNYDGEMSWNIIDCQYFIPPFIIYICYLIAGLKNKLFSRQLFAICSILILLQIFAVNFPRLNKMRGGWGNYFCAWNNAEKFINKASNNALTLSLTNMPYKPFTFRTSNNVIVNSMQPCENSQFCDLVYIQNQLSNEKYSDVFVLSGKELKFRGSAGGVTLKETVKINGDTGDLYDNIKHFLGKSSVANINVYHFINNSKK